MAEKIDLSKASTEELGNIKSEVLRQLASRASAQNADDLDGHDSHSSSHSKNSVTFDSAFQAERE